MRKELIWAGIIGITFGLIIAFGAWRISLMNSKVSATPSPTPASAPTEFKITLDKPENDDVVTQNSVTVSGITKALTWITVSGEKGDYIVQSDAGGVFTQDVDLTAGVNQIKVTAFDPQGASSIQKVLVVYSSSFQETSIPTPTPGGSSTESAIRANVQEKVAQALNKPKAYLGVVTDIADSTIQLKTDAGEIKQVATGSGGTSVMDEKGTDNKTVKLTDIAIGDFIVAMGYVNSASVLSAQRILITDPVTEPKIDSFYGKVASAAKKSVSVAPLAGGQAKTLTPDANTDVESYAAGKTTAVKLSAIGTGDSVIYVMDSSPTTPVVHAIFIIQKAQS